VNIKRNGGIFNAARAAVNREKEQDLDDEKDAEALIREKMKPHCQRSAVPNVQKNTSRVPKEAQHQSTVKLQGSAESSIRSLNNQKQPAKFKKPSSQCTPSPGEIKLIKPKVTQRDVDRILTSIGIGGPSSYIASNTVNVHPHPVAVSGGSRSTRRGTMVTSVPDEGKRFKLPPWAFGYHLWWQIK
jgi:hypothetical protein